MTETPAPVDRLVGLRIGDTVHHKPTGEDWLVARVLHDGIFCAGWPCTKGYFQDMHVIERCSDKQHADLVERLKNIGRGDPRHIEQSNPLTEKKL